MLEDANPIETPIETPAAAPASQPAQGGDTPAATPSQDAGPAPQEQGVQQQQPPTIPKWRFDELNQRMQAAEARLREVGQPQAPQPSAPQAPKQDDFSTYEEYIRADARFVAQQEARQAYAAERQREEQASRQQYERNREFSAQQNWTQRYGEAATKYSDFEMKMATAPNLAPHALAVLKLSPVAGDLAYHIASDHALIQKINAMHPLDQAAELGRIEGKLQGSSGQPPRKPSAGIPAITPVAAGNKPGSRSGDQLTQDDVIAKLYPTS